MTTRVLPKLKPMLAGKATDEQISKLFDKFKEMYASPKLDGIRCMIQDGIALSRSLKPIRNEFIQSILGHSMFDGLDGEIISGDPTADDVYRITTGNVMRATGKPDFTFWVFDTFIYPYPYGSRRHEIYHIDPTGIHPNIKILPTVSVFNMKELQAYEQYCLGQGYEGVILRDPNALYKHGRSTAKEGGLIKVKRFSDSEATILGMEEQMKNNNEKKVNELGRGQRSSHKENKTPKGTLGALVCKDKHTGIQFNIGSGFDDATRNQLWKYKDGLIGQAIKYKYFSIGVKDAPRHPVYIGMRDDDDMS
jgi:DNA ligase-1|tara:strand:- start:459 stop:1379 length:921 start_codon:yes stop_codon:yes gene_type:complete